MRIVWVETSRSWKVEIQTHALRGRIAATLLDASLFVLSRIAGPWKEPA